MVTSGYFDLIFDIFQKKVGELSTMTNLDDLPKSLCYYIVLFKIRDLFMILRILKYRYSILK